MNPSSTSCNISALRCECIQCRDCKMSCVNWYLMLTLWIWSWNVVFLQYYSVNMMSCVQSNKKDVSFSYWWFFGPPADRVSCGEVNSRASVSRFVRMDLRCRLLIRRSDPLTASGAGWGDGRNTASRHAARLGQCLPSKCGRGVKKEHLVAVRCAALDSRTHSAHSARIKWAPSRNPNSRKLHLEGSCSFRGCWTRLIDENRSGQSRSPSDKEPFSLRRAALHRRPCRTSPRTLTTTRGPRLRSRTTTFRRLYSGFCWLWSSPAGTCSCASACTWRKL